MNMYEVTEKAKPGTVGATETQIFISHYPESQEVYAITEETEDVFIPRIGLVKSPVVVLQNGSPEALQAQADASQARLDKIQSQIKELQATLEVVGKVIR